MKDIKALSAESEAYYIEKRHYYHAHPEISFHEVETTKAITRDLEKLGIEYRTFSDHTGVLGVIRGTKPEEPGKKARGIMLRADIDALAGVVEKTGLPFSSDTDSCSHACGHDYHTATLLGAAKLLMGLRNEFSGTVHLCFDPAEETVEGAPLMIRDGCLDGMDACFGMHIWSQAPAGIVCVQGGNLMAAGGQFTITIEGLAAHASTPHEGHDAIVAAGAVIAAIQTYVSRRNNPTNPLVVTVGTIHGGSRWNVIANHVVLEGTIRSFDPVMRAKIGEELQELIGTVAAAYQTTAVLDYHEMWPATINRDPEMVNIAGEAVKKLFGEERLSGVGPAMGGESFSFYLEKIPGLYAFMGCRDEAHPYGNHHEKFDMDESLLKDSVAMYVQVALDYLNR